MHSPPLRIPPPEESRRSRLEWVALTTLLCVIGIVLAWTLSHERRDVETLEGERLQVQAHLIDDNLLLQVEGANKAIQSIRDDLRQLDPALNGGFASDKLRLLTDAMPGVSTMAILDGSGRVVASNRGELIGSDLGSRPYFLEAQRSSNPDVLYLSSPFKSIRGTWVVVLSRVVVGRAGEFLGLVIAAVDPAYFQALLKSVLYASDMHAALVDADGSVFLDVPEGSYPLEVDAPSRPGPTAAFRASGAAASLSTVAGPGSTGDRLLALRTAGRGNLDRPMIVAVSRDVSTVLRPWHEKAVELAVVFVALAVGLCTALHFGQRRRQAVRQVEQAVAAERQVSAERLEFALSGAKLGLWDLHLPTGRMVVNERERAILGLGPTEVLPTGDGWREGIHPDDWPEVDAALRLHMRGETAAYGCEHRVAHRDGRWVWVASRAMIVERDAKNRPVRIIGTHLDITERKQTEAELGRAMESLRQSEAQLLQVTDNMPALVSRVDRDLRFKFANRVFQDWLGRDPATLIGRTLSEVYGADTAALIAPQVAAALQGERVTYERDQVTLKGLCRVEVTLTPERADDGSVTGLYVVLNDISARHKAERLRTLSEERLSLALEASGLALFDWDIVNDRMYQSAQAATMRGDAAETTTATAAQMRASVHPDDLARVLAAVTETVTGVASVFLSEFRLAHRSGAYTWVRAHGRVVERDAAGRAVRVAGTYSNIESQKQAEEELRRAAEVDDLTGLLNRAVFNERLTQAMAHASVAAPMALLFLDVDRFKSVNDTLGHEAGDAVLKTFATRMLATVRPEDTVARLAGDEFTIILETMRHAGDAIRVAAKLTERLRAPIELPGRSLRVTASIGVAIHQAGETEPTAFLHRADLALYEAKRRGRDGFYCAWQEEASLPIVEA